MRKRVKKFAVVAMALKFPGANHSNPYWEILKNGKETIHSFSAIQSLKAGADESLLGSATYRPYKGILDHLEQMQQHPFKDRATDFSALSIQAQVMMHLTDQALNSMQKSQGFIKNTALFIGTHNQLDVQNLQLQQPTSTQKITTNYYLKTVAPYIAYEYGFQGAALDIYAACSSSSVAVIQACKELSLNQCDMAIAGGVSISLPQHIGYLYEKNGILSEDGHCRPFDQNASGTIISNGAGVLVLKRYEDALANNDFIHALIIGYGLNNDGNAKIGFLDPGINGQYSCLRSAWDNAGIHVNDLDYIEAHGAATPLGDAVEMYALKKAMNALKRTTPCPVGSVKSNLGHTVMASGIASLIKTILMLKHKALVPSINFTTLNEHIFLENSPLYVATSYQKFPNSKPHYTAGVSNFGLGGTNTHIVLQSI